MLTSLLVVLLIHCMSCLVKVSRIFLGLTIFPRQRKRAESALLQAQYCTHEWLYDLLLIWTYGMKVVCVEGGGGVKDDRISWRKISRFFKKKNCDCQLIQLIPSQLCFSVWLKYGVLAYSLKQRWDLKICELVTSQRKEKTDESLPLIKCL